MSRQIKKTSVPKLRFPEFRDTREWEENNILNMASLKARIGWQNLRQDEHLETGEYFLVTGTDFVFEKIDWLHAKFVSYDRYIQDQNIILKDGDILITKDGSIGKVAYVENLQNKKATLNNGIFRIRIDNEYSKFIFYTFLSTRFKNFLHKLSGGSSIVHLYQKDFEKYEIAYPTIREQQKIADCLSSIDELLTAQAQKLDTLKIHKKGLMQQLLPAEGETLPKLRFPEFRNAGEWEQRLIEDFFFVGSSKRVLQQDWTTQGVPFYRTRELVSLSKNEPFGSEIFISEELFRDISEKYGLPTEGDFLVSGVGTLGISYQVQAQDRFYFKDGNVLWFKLKGGIVSTFFKYCFEADEIQNQILGQASISTVGTYTIQNAKATKFSCPPNIEEQQKIANCLASLDERITLEAQKLDTLKTHKKGLMQQIFPVLDEVQG